MKYVDEKRMRVGYVAIFGIAVLLIGGAFWDATYNGQQLLTWFISGLGGLLVLAIVFFVATEMILKDALDLRPKSHVIAYDSEGLPVSMPASMSAERTNPAPTYQAAPVSAPMMASPSQQPSLAARLNEPSHERQTWSPTVQPRVVKPTVAVPAPIVVVAKPAETHSIEEALPTPKEIPRPSHIPPAPHGVKLESLAYEVGNHNFRIPRGAGGHHPHTVLENTRILCGNCGLYFRVDLERSRPVSVPCPRCEKDLGLSGATQNAEHVKMRCRHCGDFLKIPRVADHKATQCATCGQING